MQTTDIELIENYNKLKTQIESSIAKSSKESDLTRAKEYLVEVQSLFKTFKLRHDHREELWQSLQYAFEAWHKRRSLQNESFEREARANYITLKSKIDETLQRIADMTDNYAAKEMLRELQAQFKGIKLTSEHREELFSNIQKAFDNLNFKIDQQRKNFELEASLTFKTLSTQIFEAVEKALQQDNTQTAKDLLKAEQANLRNAVLTKDQREQLYNALQNAFTQINTKIENEIRQRETTSLSSYTYFIECLTDVEKRLNSATDVKPIRDELKNIQSEISKANLLREHRNELWETLQSIFAQANKRWETDKVKSESDVEVNYQNLKKQVDEALKQAQLSTEYKQTRNFIVSVQKEFKGLRLRTEDREELWSKINTAFDTLNHRIDDYYRNKRGDWEVRMQTRISEAHQQKSDLEKEIAREREQLRSLLDQLSILKMRNDSDQLIEITRNKIKDTESHIESQLIDIEELNKSIENLEKQIDAPEN